MSFRTFMLFNMETDSGSRVTGYVVPDGYSEVPSISVRHDGIEILSLPANEIREALVVAGRHATGQCGFSIGVEHVADIQRMADLEIVDADTGVLIYRRPRPQSIKKKVLRLESHLFPLWRLDDAFGVQFQYFAKGIESYGRETVTQLFLLNQIESVYLSGRILFKNYSYYAEAGFETIYLIQDPYQEIAERLLVLRNMREQGSNHLGIRDNVGMKLATEFAEYLLADDDCFDDIKELKRRFRDIPDEACVTLSNPMARQLTSSTPDEMPTGGAVAAALDLLASFAVVGVRDDAESFLHAIAELTGIDPAVAPPVPVFSKVAPLAKILQSSGVVDGLLETDLELYHYVHDAVRKLNATVAFGRVS